MKTCQWQEPDDYCFNLAEGRTDYCPRHNRLMRKAEETAKRDAEKLAVKLLKQKEKQSLPKPAINKVSKKRKDENATYSERRRIFLLGKRCVVFPTLAATTVHHAKGRIGYADNWARDKGITLFLDERYWIPASLEGHEYIEHHPQEAKDRGWSQSRLENLDQEIKTI